MNDTLLDLVEGDITELDVDAIVSPTGPDLEMTGKVAKVILEKGGESIQQECERIGGADVGSAVMTGAGELDVKQVVHAVGPKMGEGDEDRKLASAVRSALALADRNGLKSVGIPAISVSCGFPMSRCARILLTEVHRYLQGGTKLESVIVCLHGDKNYQTFRRELRRGFR